MKAASKTNVGPKGSERRQNGCSVMFALKAIFMFMGLKRVLSR